MPKFLDFGRRSRSRCSTNAIHNCFRQFYGINWICGCAKCTEFTTRTWSIRLGLSRDAPRSNAPRLDRLKKLILPGNLICERTSWREFLREAVNLERIENCTFLPEIVIQNKTSRVKSMYLNFDPKPNPAIDLTLQENFNVFHLYKQYSKV